MLYPVNKLRLLLVSVTLATLLTGCAGIASNGITCPELQQYSEAEQDQAANELEGAIKNGAVMLPRFIDDYGVMRDQCRL